MVDAYENQSQFAEGTETVTLYATDSAAGTSVANALVGELTNREASQLGTLNVETRTIAIELDAADLGGVVPAPGCKIVRTSPSSSWRIISMPAFDHVIGVYRCLCSELK